MEEIAKQMHVAVTNLEWLELDGNPVVAARLLYGRFHEISARGSVILVEKKEDMNGENWEFVWDRIVRSATVTL
jgi:hypothetical protein